MITVYGCPNTRSVRVVWALEEIGADYDYRKIDLQQGEGRTPQFLAINPGGKVPALVEDGWVLTESAAICLYLGDRFPDAKLTPPAGSRQRAQHDQWCIFAVAELEQPLWTMAKHRFALPEERRVPAIVDTARWEFSVAAKVLDVGLGERPFILGDAFSAADILLGNILQWAGKYELPLPSERLQNYRERVLSRPALARARARENG